MSKKDDDERVNQAIEHMLEQFGEKYPEVLEVLKERMKRTSSSDGMFCLDELEDFKSNRHEVPTKSMSDFEDMPKYVNFWEADYHLTLEDQYADFMKNCEARSENKKKLSADINMFLSSVPVSYNEDAEYISSTQLQIIAVGILKYDLQECHLPMLNLLRCEDYFIEDCLMKADMATIELYAEMCHGHLDELYDIATDDDVHPFARGIAIGALTKSIHYAPENALLIQGMLRKVIETYAARAKKERKVAVALIRSTALCAATMGLTTLLPLLRNTYTSLRISKKGLGAMSNVEEIMDMDDTTLGLDISTKENLESFLKFQSLFHKAEDDLLGLDDDEDYDDDDDDDDDDDEEDYDDDEDEDYDDDVDYDDEDDEDNDDDDEDYDDDDDDEADERPKVKLPKIKVSDIRNAKLTNGRLLILNKDIAKAHPVGLSTATDGEYARFANGIVSRIRDTYGGLTSLDIKTIAMKCTLYFEDVIADAGIWRSFVETMRTMYGKPLPFYEVDEASYFSDEPNRADVNLLIWLALIDSNSGMVSNPLSEVIFRLSDIIYDYMDEMFEKMPVNDALADFFHKGEFTGDFLALRDVLKWAYLASYLTSTMKAMEHFVDIANDYAPQMFDEAFGQTEAVVIFEYPIGPLHLLANEWIAMILQSNGRKEEAAVVREMEGKLDVYHIVDSGDNLLGTHTLQRADGVVVEVSDKNFQEIELDDNEYFMGCMAKYKDDWYLSGTNGLSKHLKDVFEKMLSKSKAEQDVYIVNYDELVKDNGGSQLFYFKDNEDLAKFIKEKVKTSQPDAYKELMATLEVDAEKWVLFLQKKFYDIYYFPDAAQFICDKNNPMYDEKEAEEDYLSFPNDCPYFVAKYLVDHDMLPCVRFGGTGGKGVDRKLFRDNYDFVLRCLTHDSSVIL